MARAKGAGVPVELAQAYVSVALSTKGLGKDIVKNFQGLDSSAAKAGESAGKQFTTAFGRGSKRNQQKNLIEQEAKAAKAAIEREAAAVKKARELEEAATRKVRIEEQKLQEARSAKSGKQSTILAAEDRLTKARQAQARASGEAGVAAGKLSRAEDDLAKATKRGEKANRSFGQSFKDIFKGKNPFSKASKQLDGVGRNSATLYGSGFRRGLAAFSYANVFGNTFKNITRGVALSGTTAGVAFAAGLTLGFKKSADAAGNFQAQIKLAVGVSDVAGAAADRLESKFSNLAFTLSKGTIFSAQQASEAIVALAKGGMGPAEVAAGGLKGAMDLAAAGGLELGESADFVIKGLSIAGLKAKDTTQVINALAGAANASVADVQDIGLALAQVGPGARAAGFTIQETTAAIAAFSNAGLKGSDAGTSLKTFITNLVPASKKARDLMKDLGLITARNGKLTKEEQAAFVTAQKGKVNATAALRTAELRLSAVRSNPKASPATLAAAEDRVRKARETLGKSNEALSKSAKHMGNVFFDAQGKVKPMSKVAEILHKKLGGLSKEQQILATRTLFGSDASRAAQILTREGAKGLEKYLKATSKASAAQDLARKRTEGWNGAKTKLTNGIKTLQIQIGTYLLPKLTDLANYVTQHILPVFQAWIKQIGPQIGPFLDNLGKKLLEIGGKIRDFAKFIYDNRQAIFDLTKIFGPLILGIVAVSVAMRIMNAVMRANPIGLIITGIYLLITGLIYAYKHSETFRNVVNALWAAIKVAFAAIVKAAIVVIEWFKGPFRQGFENFLEWIRSGFALAWAKFKEIFIRPITLAYQAAKIAFSQIKAAIWLAWIWVSGAFRQAWNGFKNIFITPVVNAYQSIKTHIKQIIANIYSAWTWASGNFKKVWAGIKKIITDPIGAAKDAINLLFSSKKPGLLWVFDQFVSKAKTIWDKIQGVFKTPVKFVVETVINGGLLEAFNWVTDALKIPLHVDPIKLPKGFATGGWTGPGDKFDPAGVVHADEFVVKKKSRRKFERDNPGFLDYVNQTGTMPDIGRFGFANGGLVPFQNALKWARQQVGKPYVFGAAGPGGYDCSGFMGAIQNFIYGNSPYSRRWSTPAFAGGPHTAAGFIRNHNSPFMIGVNPQAGRLGHTAGTLMGVNVESAGGVGVRMGKGARGATTPFFQLHYGLSEGPDLAVGPGFFDGVKAFAGRITGPMKQLGSIVDSPWGNIVEGVGRTLATSIGTKIKSVASDATGFASGTRNASPGWHWVGERGPELMRMHGGEQVLSNEESMGAGGVVIKGGYFGYNPEEIFKEANRQRRKSRMKNNVFG